MSAEGTQPIGDLTATEQRQVQSVVDRMQRDMDRRFGSGEIPVEISVVGSAARGERRNVGSDLSIGHGSGTRSDIDYLAPRQLEPLFNAAHRNSPYQVDELPHLDLPSFDRFQGLMTGAPHSGAPEIVFRAGQEPEIRAARPEAAEGTPRAPTTSAGGDCPLVHSGFAERLAGRA